MERRSKETTFVLTSTSSAEALFHPLLGFTAVVAARWRGLLSFHAGAFELCGRAWGILGDKNTGKSSLLAALSRLGNPIIADDVLILEDGCCLAGPRCVDLRTSSAPYFPKCRSLGVIGKRERWRLRLDPVRPMVPMAGWITLEWGTTNLAPMAWADRIDALKRNFAILLPPADPAGLLEVSAWPMLRFSRERDLEGLDHAAASLCRMLEEYCWSSPAF